MEKTSLVKWNILFHHISTDSKKQDRNPVFSWPFLPGEWLLLYIPIKIVGIIHAGLNKKSMKIHRFFRHIF